MDIHGVIKITKINLKHNFLMHFIAAVIIALLTAVVFSISQLDKNMSAQPIEMMLSFIGIILITPLLLPEQNENIYDVVTSKRTSYIFVCIIRLIYSVMSIMLIIGIFITIMYLGGCDVTMLHFFGGIITALFLGSLGLAAYGFSRNISVAYMAPVLYYIANMAGKDKLGNFFIFSMTKGSFSEKYYLLALSFLFIIVTMLFYRYKSRL